MPALIAFLTKILAFIFTIKIIRFFIFGAILLSADDIVLMLIRIFVPQLKDLCSLYSSVPEEVGFFLQYFEIPTALKTILSAYLMRFAIRRLPFVGG
jgi:hypothetical protein|uniref:DUF2523 domain-containing protein n=1 Tax=Inoviridae sp. ctFNB4 TaxID=2823614 RepID=A0A8S5LBL4_9VIRU|nr:MAG TPA: Protein of unknown function DUF2523 [Inoviridae sp. ctFNB4]